MAHPSDSIQSREHLAELRRRLQDPQGTLSATERELLEREIQQLQALLGLSRRATFGEAGWLAWIGLVFAASLMVAAFLIMWTPADKGMYGLDFCFRFPFALMIFLMGFVWMIESLATLTGASAWWLALGILFLVGLLGAFVVFAFSRC
jgi:hypothetical protein